MTPTGYAKLGLIGCFLAASCGEEAVRPSPLPAPPRASSLAGCEPTVTLPDPIRVLDRADAQRRAGEYEAALRSYLWVLDEGLRVNPPSVGVVMTTLPRSMLLLGTRYPPALVEMRGRLAALRARMTEGRDVSAMDVVLYAQFVRILGTGDELLTTYRSVAARGEPAEPTRHKLYRLLLDELLDAGAHDLVATDAAWSLNMLRDSHGSPRSSSSAAEMRRRVARVFDAMLQTSGAAAAREYADNATALTGPPTSMRSSSGSRGSAVITTSAPPWSRRDTQLCQLRKRGVSGCFWGSSRRRQARRPRGLPGPRR